MRLPRLSYKGNPPLVGKPQHANPWLCNVTDTHILLPNKANDVLECLHSVQPEYLKTVTKYLPENCQAARRNNASKKQTQYSNYCLKTAVVVGHFIEFGSIKWCNEYVAKWVLQEYKRILLFLWNILLLVCLCRFIRFFAPSQTVR